MRIRPARSLQAHQLRCSCAMRRSRSSRRHALSDCRPNSMLSRTVFHGNSANCWNTTARSGPGSVTVVAVDRHVAAGRKLEARDHAHARGLAATRRADDRDEFAVAHLEVHTFQRDESRRRPGEDCARRCRKSMMAMLGMCLKIAPPSTPAPQSRWSAHSTQQHVDDAGRRCRSRSCRSSRCVVRHVGSGPAPSGSRRRWTRRSARHRPATASRARPKCAAPRRSTAARPATAPRTACARAGAQHVAPPRCIAVVDELARRDRR